MPALIVSLVVAAAQLWFVATAGNDLPLDDQWNSEGAWLYPSLVDGTLRFTDLLAAHNEHRIVWTHLLNLALFHFNGQWDPTLQILVLLLLRAIIAGGIVAALVPGRPVRVQVLLMAAVALLFMPHLAWHNVIWGFQTQVYFCLGFSVASLWLLSVPKLGAAHWIGGVAAGVMAQLGMSAGVFVAAALLATVGLRAVEQRGLTRDGWRLVAAALVLMAIAALLRKHVPEHDSLRATSVSQFVRTLGLGLAWPYPGNGMAALVLNAPFAAWILFRITKRFPASHADDFALAAGLFSLAAAGAQAVYRGGGAEFAARVPSRYADFLVMLVVANLYGMVVLSRIGARPRKLPVFALTAWSLIVFSGWVASSFEAWRYIIRPRMLNIHLPVQLVRSYQTSNDPAVFEGYPRLFVPHPNVASIGRVVRDPRLTGKLPPSLQPESPVGILSRGARWLLRHHGVILVVLVAVAAAFSRSAFWSAKRECDPNSQ
jgi:hypothetical protein